MPVWMQNHRGQDDDNDTDNNDINTALCADPASIGDVCPEESCTLLTDGFLIADALEHEAGAPEDIHNKASGRELSIRLVWELSVGSMWLQLSTNQRS